jgi:ABC-type Na+ efflux pump permease subunit
MENLLAMPTGAVEIMFGKLAPYVLIGAGHAILILAIAFLSSRFRWSEVQSCWSHDSPVHPLD